MKQKRNKFFKDLQAKRKIVVSDPVSFKPKFTIVLSRLSYFFVLLFLVLFIAFIAYLAIAYTSLKKYIPGYPTIDNIEQVYETDIANVMQLAAMEQELVKQKRWIANLQHILTDKDSILLTQITDSIRQNTNYKNIIFERKIEDSLLREKVAKEDEMVKKDEIAGLLKKQSFIHPVEGKIIKEQNINFNGFNYLTDSNQKVKSSMKGHVVTADNEKIVIQHPYNILTVYKNCNNIKVKPGEEITRGKQISTVIDTLFHFEVWYKGKSVDIKTSLRK